MRPEDPIAQSIDFELAEGMTDPSRVRSIMRILPQIVGEVPEVNPVGGHSGLPQTGEQALADVGSLAGQAPSGLPGDVRMRTDLGKIYGDRAELTQRADVFQNEANLRRASEVNRLDTARAGLGMQALKWLQDDRKLAQEINANKRLLAQDARMRIEFIGQGVKAAGEPGSPEHQAYMDSFMGQLRDPAKRQALLDPQTGVEAMVSIMDTAMQASRGRTGPSARADTVTNVVSRIPEQAAPGAMQISPEVQQARDTNALAILEEELASETDPQYRAYLEKEIAARKRTITPTMPTRVPGESEAKFQERLRAAEEKRIADERANETLRLAQKADQRAQDKAALDVQQDRLKLEEQALDAKRIKEGGEASLTEAIETARTLQKHPGLPRIIGSLDARTLNITQKANDAQVLYDNVVGATVMQALNDLKSQSKTGATGFGALSDKELKVIRDAASRLAQNQSETQFRQALSAYIAKLENSRRRIVEDYNSRSWAK